MKLRQLLEGITLQLQKSSINIKTLKEYIHIIGHYNPSVRIIDLVSHTTYVVAVNFIHKWRDQLFMAILFTLRVFARNLLRGNRRRNTFCILF